MIVVVILLILAVIVLAVWGATAAAGNAATSATALTLATTNAALQTIVVLLACALVAALPLMLFAFWRLGAWRAERDTARATSRHAPRVIAIAERSPVGDPTFGVGAAQPTLLLPAPRDASQSPMIVCDPRVVMPRARRASRRTRHAAQIAQRWFR